MGEGVLRCDTSGGGEVLLPGGEGVTFIPLPGRLAGQGASACTKRQQQVRAHCRARHAPRT